MIVNYEAAKDIKTLGDLSESFYQISLLREYESLDNVDVELPPLQEVLTAVENYIEFTGEGEE